ncbi:MAG: hypothetical protein RLZZ111_1256 [Planctomycetota bacterium]|jgi:hypothetical protein
MPNSMHEPTSIAAGTADAGASVDFTWAGDRWQHSVRIRRPGGETADSWGSVEGSSAAGGDPRWPASPVLVELSAVALPGAEPADGKPAVGKAVVGVGLAGRSHFSAAIARDPDRPGAIRFEIACRLTEPPGWIGSTYRVGTRLVQVVPRAALAPLPRTVTWSYSLGPDGLSAGGDSDVLTAGA